jgi:beta-N-acetylhexosaminidase
MLSDKRTSSPGRTAGGGGFGLAPATSTTRRGPILTVIRRRWFALLLLLSPALVSAQTARPTARVRRLLETMSIEDQVGQLVMPWLLGNYLGFDADGMKRARDWIDSLHLGGIIISTGSPLDVAAKLNFLQQRSRLPLLISSDLEYGSAFRLQGGTPFPTNMGVAATGREADAYEMGRITAEEGRAVGIHLNFGPVADINLNPANPIINVRSFGEDPNRVARLVTAAIKGSQDAGMLATAKHFPGHGDTETDSHISVPVVRADWARLNAVELVPFRAAIAANAAVVMTGHVALPEILGDSTPATLAPAILRGLLRDSLGFKGLVVTDALDMGALVREHGGGEAAILAFLAGSDLLLMPADPAVAVHAVVAAVRRGRIGRDRLRESVARVLTIKEQLGLFRRRTVSLERIGHVVGQKRFVDAARSIAARSIVLVHDDSNAVRQLRESPARIAVIGYGEVSGSLGTTFVAQLMRHGHQVTSFRLTPASGPASYDSAAALLATAPNAAFAVAIRVRSGTGSIGMPDALARLIEASTAERPTVLVSFGSPYLERQVPTVRSLLLAWDADPLAEEAAAGALAGAPITGRLPIQLPPTYPIDGGLQLEATDRYATASGR